MVQEAKALELLYFMRSVVENAGHCKCSVFLMKIQRRNFSPLLESGLAGFLQFGFSPRHLEACDRLLASSLWLLESLSPALPGRR